MKDFDMTPQEAYAVSRPIKIENDVRRLAEKKQYEENLDRLAADEIEKRLSEDRATSLSIISKIDALIPMEASIGSMCVEYPLYKQKQYIYNLYALNDVNKMVIADFKKRGFGISLGTTTTSRKLSGNDPDYPSGTMESKYYTHFKFSWDESSD
jgi:hypothetical protein